MGVRNFCILLITYFLSLINSRSSASIYEYGLVGNETDLLSLLAFKANIVDDPLLAMSSWKPSVHFCKWQGVTCGAHHPRVVTLDLRSKSLAGPMSPHIGNMSFLRELILQNNSLTGRIPPEIGRLPRLRVLKLNNNSISGPIPGNISHCTNLLDFRVSYNKLVGKVPNEFGSLSKLEKMVIHDNNLTGTISTLGNLTSLQVLSITENNFFGELPDSFSYLRNLTILELGSNGFSGTIPPSLFNLSSLSLFDVTSNQIEGTLPHYLGTTLPNLKFLGVGNNLLEGPFPTSISNATNLDYLIMAQNKFTGQVPDMGKLNGLKWLSLSNNQLGKGDDGDLAFFSSLVNSTYLQILGVNINNFGGVVPNSIGNLSKNLQTLYLDSNPTFGKIPPGIANLESLESLSMLENQLSGSIPSEIGKLRNLQELNLFNNKLTGNIPLSLGNLSFLNTLDLGTNSLEGIIPLSLGKLTNLLLLSLQGNNLTSNIPKEVLTISSLTILFNLSQNRLTGSLPLEVGNLVNLGYFDVSNNLLSGEIPSTLRKCMSLERVHLGSNSFSGTIPSSFNSLRGIRELDLSNNNFSGEIPKFLEDFKLLENLNLSYNNFQGMVPIRGIFENSSKVSVAGNDELRGGIAELRLPKCNFKRRGTNRSKKTLILAISLPFGFLCLSLVRFLLYMILSKKKNHDSSLDRFKVSLARVSYQDLLEATNGFSSSNLIGVGSFGSVYKGVLNDTTIAVKVFNLLRQGASKSFISECETLRNIRHRNLVKVLTTCSGVNYEGDDFKALVYEYMVNGSLEEWLHSCSQEGSRMELKFLQRLDIAIDVASALDYLHNHGQTPIVHCDLKPSNVLLDEEMTGHVGDFGLAKFLLEATNDLSKNVTSSIGIRGTVGYAAPEYGMGSEVSTQGDVYSFGIVLLEMFTRKRPIDGMFKDGLSLHSFVKEGWPGNPAKVVDQSLFLDIENEESNKVSETLKHLDAILEIGLAFSQESPAKRMEISDVVAKLHSIKSTV